MRVELYEFNYYNTRVEVYTDCIVQIDYDTGMTLEHDVTLETLQYMIKLLRDMMQGQLSPNPAANHIERHTDLVKQIDA